MDKNILIIGATSAIAEATARIWAAEGCRLYLVGRNPDKLALVSRDLESRGAQVTAAELDVSDFSLHAPAMESAFQALMRVDVVLLAFGDLPDQLRCEQSEAAALSALTVNAASVMSLLTIIANRLRRQRSGVIAVLGSVAGDRGRKSNYVYGSCKALVATFMEGSRAPALVRCPRDHDQAWFRRYSDDGAIQERSPVAQPASIAAIIHARSLRPRPDVLRSAILWRSSSSAAFPISCTLNI